MAILFFGTPDFAVPSLIALLDAGEEVSLIVTQPDKRKGRSKTPSVPPVKSLALERGIPVLQPVSIKEPSFLQDIKDQGPEFIVVVAYGKILPPDLLTIPSRGCINVHASLLPSYRGAAPIQWSIINGESVTGVTTMLMDSGLDTGDILLQKSVPISEKDSASTLSKTLSETGAALLVETIQGIRSGSVHPKPQEGPFSLARPLEKKDGRIDWSKSSHEIFNFIRGMFPWPGAFSYFRDRYIKILEAAPGKGSGIPGRISSLSSDTFQVGTGNGLMSILKVQPEGKSALDARSFMNGYRIREGETFV